MNMPHLLAACLLCLLTLTAHAEPSAKEIEGVSYYQLANGLRLVVQPDRSAPLVAHWVMYQVGAVDEPDTLNGISHVLEHMMFKATKQMASGEFSKRVAQMGGTENAFTAANMTCYWQFAPSRFLPQLMAMEADRMQNLQFDQAEFARELEVVKEERRLRTDDNPGAKLGELFNATALLVHPHRRPVIGWMEVIEKFTVQDAQGWYEKHYQPANVTVVVVGDVAPEQARQWAEQSYGKLASKPAQVRVSLTEPAQAGTRVVTLRARAEQPQLLIGFRTPRLVQGSSDPDPYALEVLASALSGYDNARLTQQLVRQGNPRIADSAWASNDFVGIGPSFFWLGGTPNKGVSVEQLQAALLQQVAAIAEHGIREEELQRVKSQLLAGRVYAQDGLYRRAQELATSSLYGYDKAQYSQLFDKLRAVTTEQVKQVAGKYFQPEQMTVGILQPTGKPPTQQAGNTGQMRH